MIDFPNTPSIGDIFYAPSSGIGYRWDGTQWTAGPTAGVGYGPTGDFCAFQAGSLPAGVSNTWVILNPTGIISGNAGSWYVPGTGVYKPPPGRYFIQGHMSGTWTGGALGMYADLRKNAVEIAWHQGTTAAASYATNIVVEATVDANGTDVFDFRGYCAGAAGTFSNVTFLAFPIAGAKGPPGDQGPPGQLGFRLINRIVPTAAQPTIDFTNIPTDINDLLLHYDLTPNANSVGTSLRFYNGAGTLVTTADYRFAAQLAAHTYNGTPSYVMGAGAISYYNAILMDYHATGSYVGNYPNLGGARGHVHIYNIRDATRIKGCNWQAEHLTDTGSYWYYLTGGGQLAVKTAITGVQLAMGAAFAAGGSASLWGSP